MLIRRSMTYSSFILIFQLVELFKGLIPHVVCEIYEMPTCNVFSGEQCEQNIKTNTSFVFFLMFLFFISFLILLF